VISEGNLGEEMHGAAEADPKNNARRAMASSLGYDQQPDNLSEV
jgi:hypothetical protein